MQIDALIGEIKKKQNPTALGLDTRYDYLPESFASRYADRSEAVYQFNVRLIDSLYDIVPCVKIQAAYYELLGTKGLECMRRTAARAQEAGLVVMIDAKRGDIGATASAYSAAYLAADSPFPCDFLTVNPYLGIDGIAPFIDDCRANGTGIFVLVRTSNPSAGDFQDLRTEDGRHLYEHVAQKVSEWGASLIGQTGYSSVGAVVGATYPEQSAQLRRLMPHTFFLVPGYGAQGATAADVAKAFDGRGSGAIVNASRSIICAHRKTGDDDFAAAARAEALKMKEALNGAL